MTRQALGSQQMFLHY